MAPEAFDLQQFAPATVVTVTLRSGVTYRLPGDPDVDEVAVILRLEGEIQSTDRDDLAASLTEAKETLKRLILTADASQDVTGLKIGPEEIVVVFALLVHGKSVAEAVASAITARNQEGGERLHDEPSDDEESQVAREGEDPGPLSLSKSSSSERSSGSDAEDRLLLATG